MRTSWNKYLWVPIIITLACGEGDIASPPSITSGGRILIGVPTVATVTVTLPPALNVDDSTVATAVATDATGQVVSGHPVTWSTRNPGVAIVSDQGVVSGVAVGTAIIDAAIDGVTDSATIVVTPTMGIQQSSTATIGSIVVSLGTYTATAIGQTTTATAIVYSTTGTIMTGVPVTWTTSNEHIVTCNGQGNVTARAFGVGTVTGTVGTVSNTVTFTIAPVTTASVASIAVSTITNPLSVGGT